MATASALLDKTERLMTRLDVALTKHAKATIPRRKDSIKDGAEIGAGAASFGLATGIMDRRRRMAEAKFAVPYDQAAMILRHLHLILNDGTSTLEQSPAFQKSRAEIEANLTRAEGIVARAEYEA